METASTAWHKDLHLWVEESILADKHGLRPYIGRNLYFLMPNALKWPINKQAVAVICRNKAL